MPVAATFSFIEEGHSLSDVADVTPWSPWWTRPTSFEILTAPRTFKIANGADEEDERTIVDLLTDQIEFANVIVINKCDRPEKEAERWKASCTTSTRTRGCAG